MKIGLDEVKKLGILQKNDGTIISTYTYKNLINDSYTLEDLKKDNEAFNITLSQQEEFDNIKDLRPILGIHDFK